MATVERPHKDALSRAIDIYRDVMRPFILRCLRRVRGSTVEEIIRRSLQPDQANTFDQNLRRGSDLASAIDVSNFHHLVERNWREAFSAEFRGDQAIRTDLRQISEARNEVSHPPEQDLDAEYTRACLYHIAHVLGRINAPDQKRAVEDIRAQLFGPPRVAAAALGSAIVGTGQQGSVREERVKCIAVDWSGAQNRAAQRKGIWIAEAMDGELLSLESSRTRDQVVGLLIEYIRSTEDLVIGLDFAFSFPEWYLQHRKLRSARELWELVEREGEEWLAGHTWPFWGRPGPYETRPKDLQDHFRQTEAAPIHRVGSNKPKSVFQVYGAGAVGTGSVRGLPFLVRLQDAGAAIWPLDAPAAHTIIEIFPRSLTRAGVTKRKENRIDYLTRKYPALELQSRPARKMVESADAFDAGVSALVMSAHAGDFARLERATEPPKSLEGEIWSPS